MQVYGVCVGSRYGILYCYYSEAPSGAFSVALRMMRKRSLGWKPARCFFPMVLSRSASSS